MRAALALLSLAACSVQNPSAGLVEPTRTLDASPDLGPTIAVDAAPLPAADLAEVTAAPDLAPPTIDLAPASVPPDMTPVASVDMTQCGGEGQPCCSGWDAGRYGCNAPQPLLSCWDGRCEQCGYHGQPCCGGMTCYIGTCLDSTHALAGTCG